MSRDFVAEAARGHGESPALSDATRGWTYSELDAWVGELARGLAEEGVGAGALVPLIVDATPEGVAMLHALVRAGATPAPLNPRLAEPEREAALDALSEAGADDGEVPRAAEAPWAVLWTSGTTGTPRGVAITADNLRHSARASAERLGLGPDDRWLASLSLAHVGGLALVTRCALLGSELYAPGAFDAAEASAAIDGGTVSHASLVPTQLLRLLERRGSAPPPASLRCALIGGALAPAELVERALGLGWPVALTYGCTEMTSQVATAPPELVRADPGTVGAPLDGVEVRIGDAGEVLARGPTRAPSYVGGDAPLADPEGWYHTGDLGRLDDAGHLWITGRVGDRIVSGGETVDAHEVEAALRAHPSVADACVVGLQDARWGEVVGALVVGADGAPDVDALDAWARERLSPAKRPKRWGTADSLPLNANGKVDRAAVRAALLG